MKKITDVEKFWNENPLWTGESKYECGTSDFFEEHRNVYIDDCFAGKIDPLIFPVGKNKDRVLDLGCGIGFWTVELGKRGCESLYAVDLTENAIHLTQKRCDIYGIKVHLSQQNAESLTFEDGIFSHVNCQGVIHHTPSTEKAIEEIARVIRPGGSASISVYYKNAILNFWPILSSIGKVLYKIGAKMPGRNRESIYKQDDVDEIVRLYDGSDNPIGKAYSKSQFANLLEPHFEIEKMYFHFFPARSLPIKIPKMIHRYLDKYLAFMIYVNLKKK